MKTPFLITACLFLLVAGCNRHSMSEGAGANNPGRANRTGGGGQGEGVGAGGTQTREQAETNITTNSTPQTSRP